MTRGGGEFMSERTGGSIPVRSCAAECSPVPGKGDSFSEIIGGGDLEAGELGGEGHGGGAFGGNEGGAFEGNGGGAFVGNGGGAFAAIVGE